MMMMKRNRINIADNNYDDDSDSEFSGHTCLSHGFCSGSVQIGDDTNEV